MSSENHKELRVGANENAKRIMYLAKEFLLNSDELDIVSGTGGAQIAAKAAENLVRLNYVSYVDLRTETSVSNGKRRTKLLIRVKKTGDFQKLYTENEANRKKLQEAKN
jgi:hypothetical protein